MLGRVARARDSPYEPLATPATNPCGKMPTPTSQIDGRSVKAGAETRSRDGHAVGGAAGCEGTDTLQRRTQCGERPEWLTMDRGRRCPDAAVQLPDRPHLEPVRPPCRRPGSGSTSAETLAQPGPGRLDPHREPPPGRARVLDSLPPPARPCSACHSRRLRPIGTVFTSDRNMQSRSSRRNAGPRTLEFRTSCAVALPRGQDQRDQAGVADRRERPATDPESRLIARRLPPSTCSSLEGFGVQSRPSIPLRTLVQLVPGRKPGSVHSLFRKVVGRVIALGADTGDRVCGSRAPSFRVYTRFLAVSLGSLICLEGFL